MIRECNVVAGGGREEIVGIGASGSTCKPALTKWRFNKLPMDAGEVLVRPLGPNIFEGMTRALVGFRS